MTSKTGQMVFEALLRLRDRHYPSLEPRYFSVDEIRAELEGVARKDINNGLAVLERTCDVWRDPNDYADGIHWRLHEQAVLNYRAEQKRKSRASQSCKLPPITRYYVSPQALKDGAPVDVLQRDRVETYTPTWEAA